MSSLQMLVQLISIICNIINLSKEHGKTANHDAKADNMDGRRSRMSRKK